MATVAKPLVIDRPAWTARLHEWVVTVDHKRIGIMYILMAIVFLGDRRVGSGGHSFAVD